MSAVAGRGAVELLDLLAAREVSAVELAREALARIDALDGEIGAFVRLNPEVLAEAAASDERRARGASGPLEGLPVAVKDNLATAGLETGCASAVLDGFVPLEDATVVRRLREAGAVILGKTNLDEFGMGSSTERSKHGPTRNPWDRSRVAGGSSGGSAAAVAAGLAPAALGSDTGGSVRQPAAFCGVVGLKPTYGRVSRFGLVAYGSSLDQVGPVVPRVEDAARLLGVLQGSDSRDATAEARPSEDFEGACRAGVSGLKVGLPREYLDPGLDPDIAAGVERAAEALRRAGAILGEVSLPHTRYAIAAYYLIATAEASSNLARYDGVRYGRRVRDPRDARELYRRSRGAGFGAEVKRRILLGTFALSAGYHDRYYGRAQRARALIRRDFDSVFGSGFDVLLTPVTPSVAFRVGEKIEDPLAMYLQDVYTTTANLAGIPALAVPAGRTAAGLPVGCQLLAPHFEERRLFRAAAEIARALPPELPAGRGAKPAGHAGA